jgi:hypothetical protein
LDGTDGETSPVRLTEKLEKLVADGRSTPGTPQKNEVPIDIFKKGK